MNTSCEIIVAGVALEARASGALWVPGARILCVSDLHLGKSGRIARRGGALLPPYETVETLTRLEAELDVLNPTAVICLGDSFDDLDASRELDDDMRGWLARMQAGRRWVWIEGNHDPGPVDIGGSHLAELTAAGLTFRHIAADGASAEVSGHYHPKHRMSGPARAAFLYDTNRLIMPAFGAYTGGLRSDASAFAGLFERPAFAVTTGKRALRVPYHPAK